MNTAATKIQAVYRGHSTRQGLSWKLPSGRTLGATLRDAWRESPMEGRELYEHSSVSSVMDASSESNGSDVETAYSHESQLSPHSQGLKVRICIPYGAVIRITFFSIFSTPLSKSTNTTNF
jgi:hypothetical protein